MQVLKQRTDGAQAFVRLTSAVGTLVMSITQGRAVVHVLQKLLRAVDR